MILLFLVAAQEIAGSTQIKRTVFPEDVDHLCSGAPQRLQFTWGWGHVGLCPEPSGVSLLSTPMASQDPFPGEQFLRKLFLFVFPAAGDAF